MVTETLEKTEWEYRADSGKLGDWQLTPEGYLIANAKIARIGIQEYQNSDGTVRREFRPPEEVASRDSLKTLCDLPVSIEHPPVMLDSSSAKTFTVGWNGSVTYDGGFVSTKIKLIDGKAVQNALDGGRVELSVGYVTKLDWTSGEWQEQKYDCIQRQIRGNHIALTVKARGGSNLRLYPAATAPNRDSVISDNCWQISETWPDAEIRFDSLRIEVGGEHRMKMYDEDELTGMAQEDLVSLVLEMQGEMEEATEEARESKDSAAYWQGKASAYEDSLSVESSLSDRADSSITVDRRVKEKEIRIGELESRIDSSESENTALRRQLDEIKSRMTRLDSDLTTAKEERNRAVMTGRESWVKTWNEALPFLPKTAIKEPDYTLDSVGIMRLALQNTQPELNLDSLVQSSTNPDDVIKTAFSVMVVASKAQASARRVTNNQDSMNQLIAEAKTSSLAANHDSAQVIRSRNASKNQEAWKITN